MPDDEPPLYLSRYPGFDVLGHASEWDPVTRDVIAKRVRDVPPIRFFTEAEARTLQALVDTLIPQDDRPPEFRVPVLRYLDERLHAGVGRGYRYESLPPDPELWRTLVAALDEEARLVGGRAFAALDAAGRAQVAERMSRGEARAPLWERIPLHRSFPVVMKDLVENYYSHPYAWNEIGWAGPRFPGIYPRTSRDNPGEPLPADVRRSDGGDAEASP